MELTAGRPAPSAVLNPALDAVPNPAPSAAPNDQPSPCDGAAEVYDCTEKDLAWALQVAARAFGQWASASVAELPGGPRGYLILATIVRGRPRSQLALAQQLDIDKTTMTYLLDELEAAGLVERRPDPADRRARQVLITTTGSRTLETSRASLDSAAAKLLEPLDSAEAAAFRQLLERIASAVRVGPGACPATDGPAAADCGQ